LQQASLAVGEVDLKKVIPLEVSGCVGAHLEGEGRHGDIV
jgi:hypothetical protein